MYVKDEEWSLLAEAVVAQAGKDYVEALKKDNKREQLELEKFFNGGWFALLTDVDPLWLRDSCRKAVA